IEVFSRLQIFGFMISFRGNLPRGLHVCVERASASEKYFAFFQRDFRNRSQIAIDQPINLSRWMAAGRAAGSEYITAATPSFDHRVSLARLETRCEFLISANLLTPIEDMQAAAGRFYLREKREKPRRGLVDQLAPFFNQFG